MIVYYKLGNILKERNMTWKDLTKSGISINMPQKFSQNKNVNSDTIDKVCMYLGVQPGDIMECVDENELKKAKLEAQMAEIQKKLDQLKKANVE